MDQENDDNYKNSNDDNGGEEVKSGGFHWSSKDGVSRSFNSRNDQQKYKRQRFKKIEKDSAKKGIYGHGSELEPDDGTYFYNILDVLKTPFETVDEKGKCFKVI